MNDPQPGTPHGHGNLLSGYFYRVVRRGPGAQQVIRDGEARLVECRDDDAAQLLPQSATKRPHGAELAGGAVAVRRGAHAGAKLG